MLTITSMAFDQPVYNPGDTMTLTVNYTSTDFTGGTVTDNATTVITDTAGSTSGAAPFSVNSGPETVMPTTVTASDDRAVPGTWTLVSNGFTGTASPFTGVAVLTSVA